MTTELELAIQEHSEARDENTKKHSKLLKKGEFIETEPKHKHPEIKKIEFHSLIYSVYL